MTTSLFKSKHHVVCGSVFLISLLTKLAIFIFPRVKLDSVLSHGNKELHSVCLQGPNWNFHPWSWDYGNTLNRPASDSGLLLWEKSTYFLSVWLAICLLEGLTPSTCSCMCSQSASSKKTVDCKCRCRDRERFLWGWGCVCVRTSACARFFGELSK